MAEEVKNANETEVPVQEAANEPAAVVAQEESKTPSARESFYASIREAYPDGKYEDDEEEIYRNANKYVEESKKTKANYDDISKKLFGRLQENPYEAEAFLDYLNGMSLPAAIRKNMGDEALSMKEGDDGWDEYVQAGKDRKAQQDELYARVEEINKNSKASDDLLVKYAKDKGMTEEEAEEFKNLVISDYEKHMLGIVDEDMLDRYFRARNYDNDIKGAREQGMVDGRNEKIELEKKRMAGSGLPNATAGGDAQEEIDNTPKKNPTADWLGAMKRRK